MLNDSEFDKSKIYEQLEYLPKPQGYNKNIPWTVQQQISATNRIIFCYLYYAFRKFLESTSTKFNR